MNWEEIIDNLNDLIETKNTKLKGYEIAIEHLRNQREKIMRELMYLKSRYDSQVEREVVDNVINLMKEILNNGK